MAKAATSRSPRTPGSSGPDCSSCGWTSTHAAESAALAPLHAAAPDAARVEHRRSCPAPAGRSGCVLRKRHRARPQVGPRRRPRPSAPAARAATCECQRLVAHAADPVLHLPRRGHAECGRAAPDSVVDTEPGGLVHRGRRRSRTAYGFAEQRPGPRSSSPNAAAGVNDRSTCVPARQQTRDQGGAPASRSNEIHASSSTEVPRIPGASRTSLTGSSSATANVGSNPSSDAAPPSRVRRPRPQRPHADRHPPFSRRVARPVAVSSMLNTGAC